MERKILYVGSKKNLPRLMDRYCTYLGTISLRNAKCRSYDVIREMQFKDVRRFADTYWGIIAGQRWHERKTFPRDYFLGRGTGYRSIYNPKYDDPNVLLEWEAQECDKWLKRAAVLLQKVEPDAHCLELKTVQHVAVRY